MGEGSPTPYSQKQHFWALILSALLGWAGVAAAIIGGGDLDRFLGLLPFAAVIGLPIAFLLTFLVGGPVLRRLMLQPVGWLRAATGGAYIAAIIAVISVLIGRFVGLVQSRDSSSYSRIGGADNPVEIDGILTLHGWLLLGHRTLIFIAFGATVGLVIRAVIGPGRRPG